MLSREETVPEHRGHFDLRASGAAAALTSCMLLGDSSPFQSKRTSSPFSSAKSYKASHSFRVMDAVQPPAPLGDASVAWSVSQGSARKFVSNIGASPVTSGSSSSRAPFSQHRLLGGNEVTSVWDTSRLANTSLRRARANAHPPRRRRNRVRFTPIAEISIVTSVSETRHSRGSPSVSETPSSRPPQISPECVLPDVPAFVSISRKSYEASARCTSMGDEKR